MLALADSTAALSFRLANSRNPHHDNDSLNWLWSGILRRTSCLRLILLVSFTAGMVISAPLWTNTRLYPLLPVAPRFPILPHPWDECLFVGMLFTLALSLRFYRVCIVIFLAGMVFLIFEDQNRCQPWVYLYWVLLLFTLLPERVALPGCRLALSAVYVWAGVQKFNPEFSNEVAPFFVAPLAHWLPEWGMKMAQWSVAAAPVLEIFIGVGLWIPACRRAAIAVACVIHATGLLLLGPLGNQFNAVVWPWNIAMVLLILTLFPAGDVGVAGLKDLLRSRPGLAISILFCLLPMMSYWGWWDSYLSFRLYSGNTARGSIFLSERMSQLLPERLKQFVTPATVPADHPLHGRFMFDFRNWAEAELGVPPIPEPRSYRSVAEYLTAYSADPADVLLLIQTPTGPIQVYELTRPQHQ